MNRTIVGVLVFVCGVLILLRMPIQAAGQAPTLARASAPRVEAAAGASIAVHVKDALGADLDDAIVTLTPMPGGAAISKESDDAGMCVFTDLALGGYQLKVTRPGFLEVSREVQLTEVRRQDLDLALQVQFSEAIQVTGELEAPVNVLNGRATMPDVLGTILLAGKKTDVLLLGLMDANLTAGNQRQVFAKIPGTQIWEHDSSGLQIGISNRGLDPNRSWETNSRMNGYDIMADVFAYPDTYFSPPLDAVERIEVVRGSASLQYGAQFGGLVNYQIKRAPLNRRFTLSSTQTTGSNALFSSHTQGGGKVGRVIYNGYYHHRQGDGWRAQNNEFDANSGFGSIEFEANEKLKVGFEVTGLRSLVHMAGGLTDAQFKEDPKQSNFPGNWFAVHWLVPQLKVDYTINSATRVSLTSAAIRGHRGVMWSSAQLATPAGVFVPYNPTAPRSYWDDHFHNFSTELRLVRHHNVLGRGSALAVGFRHYQSKMTRLHGSSAPGVEPVFEWYYPDVDRNLHNKTVNLATFAENAFRLTDRLTVTPGFRFDHVVSTVQGRPVVGVREQVRTLPLFGVGATFSVTGDTTIYGNITEAFRPTLLNDHWRGDARVVVDPNLKDMTGYVSELGYRGTIGQWLSFDIGAFYIKYNDRLGTRTTQTSTGPAFYYTNISDSRNIGIESYLETDVLALIRGGTGRSSLFVFSSVAPISARYMAGPVKGNRVEFGSNMIGRWGATYKTGTFSGSLQYSYTGGQFTDANNTVLLADASQGYIPEQRVADLTVNYGFLKNYNLMVGINNLANSKYFTRRASAYPGPGLIGADGRTVNVGIRLEY